MHTNLLSLKNGKLCQQKFWPCHENRPRQDDSNDNHEVMSDNNQVMSDKQEVIKNKDVIPKKDEGVTSIKINQSQIKSIKCFNCSTSFEDITSWQKHKKTCQPNVKKRKYYYDHIPLQTHQKGFYCPVCGKNYKDREEMRHHLKTHPLDSLIKASTSTPEPYNPQTNPEKDRKLEQESQPSTSKQ